MAVPMAEAGRPLDSGLMYEAELVPSRVLKAAAKRSGAGLLAHLIGAWVWGTQGSVVEVHDPPSPTSLPAPPTHMDENEGPAIVGIGNNVND